MKKTPTLLWINNHFTLQDLNPNTISSLLKIPLSKLSVKNSKNLIITAPIWSIPPPIRSKLKNKNNIKYLNLAGEIGGGTIEKRTKRTTASIAKIIEKDFYQKKNYDPNSKINHNILIIGRGMSSLIFTYTAQKLGYSVTSISPPKNSKAPFTNISIKQKKYSKKTIKTLENTDISYIKGSIGNFKVKFINLNKYKKIEYFGAIIFAPNEHFSKQKVKFKKDLLENTNIISQSLLQKNKKQYIQIVILINSFEGNISENFRRGLKIALSLQKKNVQTILLFKEAHVNYNGGERLYRKARQTGVLMFRLSSEDNLLIYKQKSLLTWYSPLLKEYIKLKPDFIISQATLKSNVSSLISNPSSKLFWKKLTLALPYFSQNKTTHKGLYIISPQIEALPKNEQRRKSMMILSSIDTLLNRKEKKFSFFIKVDQKKCISCLSCIKSCPHGALEYKNGPIFHPLSCKKCDICVSACSSKAITSSSSDKRIINEIYSGLKKVSTPKIILFSCNNSSTKIFEKLSLKGYEWWTNLLLYPVSCMGSIDTNILLKTFEMGTEKIIITACHNQNCKSINGNKKSFFYKDLTTQILQNLGLKKKQIFFINVASNQTKLFEQNISKIISSPRR